MTRSPDHPMNLAGPLGFEPRQSAPKALDLPLVDGPKVFHSRAPPQAALPSAQVRAIRRSPLASPTKERPPDGRIRARAFISVRVGRRGPFVYSTKALIPISEAVSPSHSIRKTRDLANSTRESITRSRRSTAHPISSAHPILPIISAQYLSLGSVTVACAGMSFSSRFFIA
jgi:hypothetical protein